MQATEYIRPEIIEIPVETAEVIAASNLENPTEGGEWGWD